MFIFKNFSTFFGHHYAHLQENKTYVTACVVLRCNKRGKLDISFNVFFVWYCVVYLDGISWSRVYMRMWCASWCVVVLDWYMYRVLSSGCTDAWVVSVWWDGCVVQVLLGALGKVCRLLQRSTTHAVTYVFSPEDGHNDARNMLRNC